METVSHIGVEHKKSWSVLATWSAVSLFFLLKYLCGEIISQHGSLIN